MMKQRNSGTLLSLGAAQGAAAALVLGAGAVAALMSRTDGLALFLIGLTSAVALTVLWFSRRYMRADAHPRLFVFRLAFVSITVFLFLGASNLATFALAWIASGWLLAGLIGHVRSWPEAKDAARRAYKAFLIGDACLVAAFLLLWQWSGSIDMKTVTLAAGNAPAGLAALVALLLLVSAAARCALPPFSGWLLSSMTAPTPVSALMHAGLVNAGGFLLLRFAPVLEASPSVRYAAVALGCLSALYGAAIMLSRPDIKRALAASTVSQMGFMIMTCGLGAYAAALWHIGAHGMFKAWLFLGSGSAIGRQSGKVSLGAGMAAAIAGATLVAGALLVTVLPAGAASVPILLALATGFATGAAIYRREPTLRGMAAVIPGAALAIATYVLGTMLTGQALGHDAAPILGHAGELVLLAIFLGAWVWQQLCTSRITSVPTWLYVRLMNAGSLSSR